MKRYTSVLSACQVPGRQTLFLFAFHFDVAADAGRASSRPRVRTVPSARLRVCWDCCGSNLTSPGRMQQVCCTSGISLPSEKCAARSSVEPTARILYTRSRTEVSGTRRNNLSPESALAEHFPHPLDAAIHGRSRNPEMACNLGRATFYEQSG